MRNIHPGEILKEEMISANALTVTAAARLIGITRANLSNVLNGKSDISAEMCYRIAGVFGGTPDIWAELQAKYNCGEAGESQKPQPGNVCARCR